MIVIRFVYDDIYCNVLYEIFINLENIGEILFWIFSFFNIIEVIYFYVFW